MSKDSLIENPYKIITLYLMDDNNIDFKFELETKKDMSVFINPQKRKISISDRLPYRNYNPFD